MKVEDKSADIEALKARAREIAWTIDRLLNPGMADPSDAAHRTNGFAMLVFPFGGPGDATWISNADRADMIKAVKEWLKHAERTQRRS